MQSFLRWAGGKRWLAPKIENKLPVYKRYHEPFVGSGVLFFALEPKCALIADTNQDLINCYRRIKYDCESVIKLLKRLKIGKREYYRIRDRFYYEDNPIKRAAYFIYINQLCWNGIYRVNRYGMFNVPMGSVKKTKVIYDADHLREASKLLKTTLIKRCDFEYAVKDTRKGDLVYFDPPYVTTHINNGFVEYNEKLFSHADEIRMADVAKELAEKRVNVLISNANHPLIRQQYDGYFNKYVFRRMSTIAASANSRRPFKELLISNFEIE